MKPHLGGATLGSFVFAAVFAAALALLVATMLARLSLPWALGLGLAITVLVVVAISMELALHVLILSMLLGPELVVGDLGQGATLERGLTLRLGDILLVIVGLGWLAKTALHKELGFLTTSSLNRPIVTYVVAAVVATGMGMLAGRVKLLGGALFLLKYIQYFVIYFMVINNVRERRQFRRFLLVIIATAVAASVFGAAQIPSGERVSAPFEGSGGEPNTFGGYLVLILAIVGGLYLHTAAIPPRLLLAFVAVLISLPMLFTLSRSSYVALIPTIAVLFVFSRRKPAFAGLLLVSIALAAVLLPEAVIQRMLFTFPASPQPDQAQVAGIELDTSTSARLRSWEAVLFEDWPKHPVFGYGVTGYRFLDAQYPRVLVETGLIGLSAFLWLQVRLLRQTHAAVRAARDPLLRGTAVGFLAGFVGLIAHSLGANTFIIVRIMESFWFVAGMVMMIPRLEAAETASRPGDGSERRPRAQPVHE